MVIKNHPRIELGTFPTPFVQAPDLGELLGVDSLWVKRDDLTGYSWGGNKIRTIEFLLADAIDKGADTLVVCGGPTSNFAAMVSVACAEHGLAVHRISYGSPPSRVPTALAVSLQSGASIEYTGSTDRTTMGSAADAAIVRLGTIGKTPYLVPRGGATSIGALGFMNAALELSEQLDTQNINDVTIVLPVGSGGTIAGLLAGFMYALDPTKKGNLNVQIIGVCVSRPPNSMHTLIETLAADCATLAGYSASQPVSDHCRWRLVDARGAGFGVSNNKEDELLDNIASHTKFLADSTYNAKAMSWLQEVSKKEIEGSIIYWHTGGALGAVDRLPLSRETSERCDTIVNVKTHHQATELTTEMLLSDPLFGGTSTKSGAEIGSLSRTHQQESIDEARLKACVTL